ncbi:hypothetical protein H4582DRAFT_2069133 [Lactarius indigo]|nr:hypothetical protein H4582DRAFT_2069133 [Lactarius indigo]
MPPRHVPKALKAKAVNDVLSDPQEGSPAPAAPVPSGPLTGRAWRTHSHVPSAAMKAKAVNDVPTGTDPQDSSTPAALVPSHLTGQHQSTWTHLPPVDNSNKEFKLPDIDSDSPKVEPMLDLSKGFLTPQSTTLGTLDSDTLPLVSDMEHFFDEFCNEVGEMMR